MKTKNLVLSSLFVLSFLLSACGTFPFGNIPFVTDPVKGSGNIISEAREVSGFDRISLEGFGEVNVKQGEEESLTITTDDNIMPYVKSEVRQSTLILDFSKEGQEKGLDATDGIKFDLVVKDLTRFDLTGAGAVFIDDLEVEKFQIELEGAGSVQINDLVADELVARHTGAGSIIVTGQVKGQEVVLTGAGNYTAFDLESDTAIVEITGVGGASLWVHETLDVQITSVGSVNYYGNPVVNQNVSGLGKLNSQGDK